MKITWFGGWTLRLHIGGEVIVWRPAEIAGVTREELLSGADRVVTADDVLMPVDGMSWRPRRRTSELDEADPAPPLHLGSIGKGVALVESPGEAPLLIASEPLPAIGRWGREAVVVAFCLDAALSALERAGPKLVALAIDPAALGNGFELLRPRLDGAGLVALDRGLAVEV